MIYNMASKSTQSNSGHVNDCITNLVEHADDVSKFDLFPDFFSYERPSAIEILCQENGRRIKEAKTLFSSCFREVLRRTSACISPGNVIKQLAVAFTCSYIEL